MEDINREETPEGIDLLVKSEDWFPYVEVWSKRTPKEMMQNLVHSPYGNSQKPFCKNIPMTKIAFTRANFKDAIPDRMRFPVSFLMNDCKASSSGGGGTVVGGGGGGCVLLTHDLDLKDYREMNAVGDFFMEDLRLMSSKRKFMLCVPLMIWDRDKEKIVDLARKKYGPNAGAYEIRNTFFSYTHESNPFRPSIALAVYAMFNARNILDMSSGWGDRLIGAIAWSLRNPNTVIRYQGYDPFADLQPRYRAIIREFAPDNFVGEIIESPFESAPIELGYYDLAFTSPPYFDFEEYGYSTSHVVTEGYKDIAQPMVNRDTQSTVRYPEMSDWVDGFLKPTLRRAALSLRIGGYLALNIEGPYVYKLLDRSSGDKRLFGNSTMRMDYQGIIGYKSDNPKDLTTHPIFVWRRTL